MRHRVMPRTVPTRPGAPSPRACAVTSAEAFAEAGSASRGPGPRSPFPAQQGTDSVCAPDPIRVHLPLFYCWGCARSILHCACRRLNGGRSCANCHTGRRSVNHAMVPEQSLDFFGGNAMGDLVRVLIERMHGEIRSG